MALQLLPTSCAANCALQLNNPIYGVWSADPAARVQPQALGTAAVTSFTLPSGQTGYVPAAQTNFNCDQNAFSSMFSNGSSVAYNMGRNCGVTATLDARDQQLGMYTAVYPTPFLLMNDGVFSGVTPTTRRGLTACQTLTNANFQANPASTYIGQVIPQTTQMPGSSATVYQAPGLVQMFPGNELVSMCSNIMLNSAGPRFMGTAAAIKAVTTNSPAPQFGIQAVSPQAVTPGATTNATDTNTNTTTTNPSTTTPTTTTSITTEQPPPPVISLSSLTQPDPGLNPIPTASVSSTSTPSAPAPLPVTTSSTPSAAPPAPVAPVTTSSSESAPPPASIPAPAPEPSSAVTTSSEEALPPAVEPVTPSIASSPPPEPTESSPLPMYTAGAAATRSDLWLLAGSLLGAAGLAFCL